MSSVQAQSASLTHREQSTFVRIVSQLRSDATSQLRLQTKLISITVALTYLVIGAGYGFAGPAALGNPRAYRLLLNIEGTLRVHGIILMSLGAFVLYTSSQYRRSSQVALLLMGFYSLCTALLVAGGWLISAVSWPVPWWYLLVAVVSLILVRVSPPIVRDRPRRTGRSGRV